MKKKYIFTASLMAFTAFGLAGCKDSFLEVTNPGADVAEEYYDNDPHLQEAVVATYVPLAWPDWSMGSYNPLNIISDIMSDDMNPGGATASDQLHWQLMANYKADANNTPGSVWIDEYSGIKRCNDVIKYVDEINTHIPAGYSTERGNYYIAQARVLRAYYYMNLWKLWGNIPYFTTNLSGDYKAPQKPADEVYSLVITDLEEAIGLNNLPMKAASGDEGRVTKAFAYMIYAEMVMYQNDTARYPKALAYMNEIINSGQYQLFSDYKALWDEVNEWSNESIFEVNYNDDNCVRSWSLPLREGGTVLPRLIGPRGWQAGTDGVDNGWGFGTVNLSVVNMYAAGDKRKDATCWNADAAAANAGITYTPAYAHTGYFLYKYLPRVANNKDCGGDKDLNFNNNYRVYRYAETLLNAAELLLKTGGSAATALNYVNQVRARAGISALSALTTDDIINERHLEFVGEGKRYWDLVRTGKAASVLTAGSAMNRTNGWTAGKKYLPIAQSELSSDANLVQNNY